MSVYRAEVVGVPALGRADVRIWSLYRDSVVGDIQSSVDVSVGDRVIVADLAARAHVHDWIVVDFESKVGRWYPPASHTHAQGDVTGLVARLEAIEARLTAGGL